MYKLFLSLLFACGYVPEGAPEIPTGFCEEIRRHIEVDERTDAGLTIAELSAAIPENATLSLSWDGASMAPWSTARWTLTGTGTDSVYIERQRDDNDCGSRIETSLSLDLSFTDGGFVSLGGRAMGSLDDGPQFRALGVVLSQTDLSAEMQEALIDNLYARNPQGTFDEDWRAWTLQGWWFHLDGTPESGTAQILGALSAADMPQNRVFARARWTIAP